MGSRGSRAAVCCINVGWEVEAVLFRKEGGRRALPRHRPGLVYRRGGKMARDADRIQEEGSLNDND